LKSTEPTNQSNRSNRSIRTGDDLESSVSLDSDALQQRLKTILEQDLLVEWQQIQRTYAKQGFASKEAATLKQRLIEQIDTQIRNRLQCEQTDDDQQMLNELLGNGKFCQHKLSQYLHGLLTNQLLRGHRQPTSAAPPPTTSGDECDANFDRLSFRIECSATESVDSSKTNSKVNSIVLTDLNHLDRIDELTANDSQVKCDTPTLKPEYMDLDLAESGEVVDGKLNTIDDSYKNRSKIKRNPIPCLVRRIIINMLHIHTEN
jgi:hypothetical protein